MRKSLEISVNIQNKMFRKIKDDERKLNKLRNPKAAKRLIRRINDCERMKAESPVYCLYE